MGSGEWAAPVPDLTAPQEPENNALRMWAGNACGLRGKAEVTGENEALPGLYRDLRSNLQRYMGGDNIDVDDS